MFFCRGGSLFFREGEERVGGVEKKQVKVWENGGKLEENGGKQGEKI